MKILFIIFLLFPLCGKSQLIKVNDKVLDPYKMEINKDNPKILLSLATDTKFSILGCYEREIFKPFTIFLKAGPAFDKIYVYTDINRVRQYKWIMNTIASGEFRYYYNLNRRIKLKKTVRNFSACYLSLEELLISKPLLILNKTGNETTVGKNIGYINIGYQKQTNKTSLSAFFGVRFPGQSNNDIDLGIEVLHGGITIGRAF